MSTDLFSPRRPTAGPRSSAPPNREHSWPRRLTRCEPVPAARPRSPVRRRPRLAGWHGRLPERPLPATWRPRERRRPARGPAARGVAPPPPAAPPPDMGRGGGKVLGYEDPPVGPQARLSRQLDPGAHADP